jgi:hypothetical protein
MNDESRCKVGTADVGIHREVLLAGLIAFLAGLVGGGPAHAQSLRAALEPFTGHWRGPFVAYTYAGERVDSLTAEHRYRWEGDVQVGTQVDRYPDGRVVRHTARNVVRNDTLFCEVTHTDGSTTVYRGQVVGEAIVWHRRANGGLVESFRERVVETPDGPEYRIDGFGVYPNDDGSASHLQFVGRYRPVHQDSSKGRE